MPHWFALANVLARVSAESVTSNTRRFPVSDDVTYSIDEDEGLADDDTMALAEEMAAKRGEVCTCQAHADQRNI